MKAGAVKLLMGQPFMENHIVISKTEAEQQVIMETLPKLYKAMYT